MKMALVGASGYGAHYLNIIDEFIDLQKDPLCCVVDPFVERSPYLDWLRERKIPAYNSLEDMYAEQQPDLVVICSPIQFHKEQCIAAMEHGSGVLCEKPLTATPEEAREIKAVWEKAGVAFGVGFQWSFSPTMLRLKSDILSGRFGKPIRLKTYISWKRNDRYYDPNGWKGRIRDKNGNLIMDSIAMNATAHYLHNILFILGDSLNRAAAPLWVEGSVYRARDIESYDTIFLRGKFGNGADFFYVASHAGETNSEPMFQYEFEKGVVTFDQNNGGEVRAVFTDGSEASYGHPQSNASDACKLKGMLEAVENGTEPVCGVDTILPHLEICSAVASQMETKNFPPSLIVREENPGGYHVRGLVETMVDFYRTGELPDEQGCDWAAPRVRAELS